MAYVKNITGHYRRLLDDVLAERPELAPASSGRTQLLFTPDPDKTFHRGATDYFSRGRQLDIGAFDTPAFVGVRLGAVTRVGPDWFDLETDDAMANGDGLTYLHKREVVGLQANSVERLGDKLWRVWPNEPVDSLPGLRPDVQISRNRDHAWEQALAKKSAERRIDVWASFAETDDGFALALRDSDGITATATVACDKQLAQNVEKAETSLKEQLGRFGSSDFSLRDLAIDCTETWFVPNSVANALRRTAVEQLSAIRLATYRRPLRRPAGEPPAIYPQESLSYLANVYNEAARAFYARHGVKLIAAAYEAHEEPGEVSLMITKHCLRYSFSLCPKQAKGITGVQGQVRAEPMELINGDERLRLEFDCKACEMHVIGNMKNHIRNSPPPAAPVHFHVRRKVGTSRKSG